MKKELTTHFLFLFVYFALITLVRKWFELSTIELFLGGVVGIVLPYADHFIYAYFLRPQETISQQAVQMLAQKNFKGAFEFLITTRRQQRKLIFHTAYFQLIFLALAFLVITSSGSMFGRGMVLGFALHLFIDQVVDLMETKKFSLPDADQDALNSWFVQFPITLNREQKRWYLVGNVVVLLLFGLYY